MNHCTLLAELISDPQLRYTQDNQTPIAEFTVSFPGLRAEDTPQQMKVVGWGNLAQDLQTQYRTGDRVLLEGRLSINTLDRPEGFKEKQVEMTAQRVHSVSALGAGAIGVPATPPPATAAYTAPATPPPAATPTPSPAAAPATPPAPEAEVDYDDIPFVRPVEAGTWLDEDLIPSDLHRPKVGFEFRKF